MITLLTLASIIGLLKSILLVLGGILNALLALLATVSVWKAYLLTGTKVLLTLLICIPVLGILIYVFWGQHKIRQAG